MFTFLATGTLLGLSAGFSPGPLFILVLSETLRHRVGAGIRAALAPLITDIPIVLLALYAYSHLSEFQSVLGFVSLAGSGFVAYLGYTSLATKGVDLTVSDAAPRSLQKGVLVNFLSPHPYLFWFTVGAQTTFKAAAVGWLAPTLFLVSFYVCLVGAKVILAIVAGKTRDFLQGKTYINTMRVLGGFLIFFALLLFRDALNLLGWI